MSVRYTKDGKERKLLRGKFQNLPATFRLGRRGLEEQWLAAVDDALAARETVKIRIGKNAEMAASELGTYLEERLRSEVVGIIGSHVLLYRPQEEGSGS